MACKPLFRQGCESPVDHDNKISRSRPEVLLPTVESQSSNQMDLLLTPADPAFPVDDVPYLAGDGRWDCGPFLTYRDRDILAGMTSQRPLTHDHMLGLLQTWFFFGLLAELLGLNEQQDGTHIIDQDQANAELDVIYEESVFAREDGHKYITGAKALALVPLIQERLTTTARSVGNFESRWRYIVNCFEFVRRCIRGLGTQRKLDYNIKYSLAALVDMTSIACQSTVKTMDPVPSLTLDKCWLIAGEYVHCFKEQMLTHGWCPSEIERIWAYPYGLNTIHYISHLKKSGPTRNHSRCQKHMCSAFQISMNSYEPAHAEQSCNCGYLSVNDKRVVEILQTTQSYPVLTGSTGSDEAHIEEFKTDMPYVAISHVR